MLHAHISTAQSDCDGPTYDSYVLQMNDKELAGQDESNWFGDIEFMERVAMHISNVYATQYGGKLEVTVFEDGTKRFEWSEATEEGYSNKEATFCTHDFCDPEERSHRDVFAEQMGY